MEEKHVTVLNERLKYLSIDRMKKLQEVMLRAFAENSPERQPSENLDYLQLFPDAKKLEGCSARTLQYYRVTISKMLQSIETPVRRISTEEIRHYLGIISKTGIAERLRWTTSAAT